MLQSLTHTTRVRTTLTHNLNLTQRFVSTSPYGRTHVWKRRAPVLPNPLPPKFPQKVIRSDGSSFTHFTTSPRSLVRLTRDTTNNPAWNTGNPADRGMEEESGMTGRMGRFRRRFEGLEKELEDEVWMEEMRGVGKAEEIPESAKRGKVTGKKK
ncbi:hypothetical protein CVT24_010025 [Panaeolus cyanescens]|uniref:Uncharacterized protein n=1 Tax=Panaeolus cyanescens TaxID=181874 RepID=A0A409W412_9AGAR|nr:hypothetical protein CVT24_010025 [Panaeolus cyanescens]